MKDQRGFSLIELTVVVIILGIIAAVVVSVAGGGLGPQDSFECKGTTGVPG